jgi:malate dehydrogenase (oxaloacetate-decarboxylating)
MEGKAMLFKRFANIDAIPIVVKTQDPDEFVQVVANIADSFGAINLEDIKAPECFYILDRLKELVDVPLMHDDQHGTAVVVLAAVMGALELVGHEGKKIPIVVSGSGAAGVAIVRLLLTSGFENIVMVDSKGIIHEGRDDLGGLKLSLASVTNRHQLRGTLEDAMIGAGVFIGVSRAGLVTPEMVASMSKDSVIIAMANPVPEILPDVALKAGAAIVATGRSDFDNQVNNALAFPSIFRAAMDMRVPIDEQILLKASMAMVEYQKKSLSTTSLLPSILDEAVHDFIVKQIKKR